MARADQMTIAAGTAGFTLMQRAAASIARVIHERSPVPVSQQHEPAVADKSLVLICCGSGNNAGDGLLLANELGSTGYAVDVLLTSTRPFIGNAALAYHAFLHGPCGKRVYGVPLQRALASDDAAGRKTVAVDNGLAAIAASREQFRELLPELARCQGAAALPRQLEDYTIIIDALYGAGLNRPPESNLSQLLLQLNQAPALRVAIDLPTGINGDSACTPGNNHSTRDDSAVKPAQNHGYSDADEGSEVQVFQADLTVTFCRYKPAHLLQPGKSFCGEIVVADIGISAATVAVVAGDCRVNHPRLWLHALPAPGALSHKYTQGHVLVLAGAIPGGGAARLAANAALRAGAGIVTLACPRDALPAYASQLTCVIPRPADNIGEVKMLLQDARINAVVLGPGFGISPYLRKLVLCVLEQLSPQRQLVLDADAMTAFAKQPEVLFSALRDASGEVVLTPHTGEFNRLFGPPAAGSELAGEQGGAAGNKIRRTRAAAEQAGAVVLYKGDDSVIAAPSTHSHASAAMAVVNNASAPWLATAGSGDVLAGTIAGMLARGMNAWQAACAGCWLHGQAARAFGPGLIATDIAPQYAALLADLYTANRAMTNWSASGLQ